MAIDYKFVWYYGNRGGDRGRLAGAGAPASNFFPAPLLIILIYLA
jgi:hypothetical protein